MGEVFPLHLPLDGRWPGATEETASKKPSRDVISIILNQGPPCLTHIGSASYPGPPSKHSSS